MLKVANLINKTLSLRIGLAVVSVCIILMTIAMVVMFRFSWQATRQEAIQTASQTLEGTVQHIDNVLLSVEQSSGNIYTEMQNHLHRFDKMPVYARKVIETNPYITGCAIAFIPNYYKEHGELFITYMYKSDKNEIESTNSPIIQPSTFGNKPYTEQVWYKKAIEARTPIWINPMKDAKADDEPIITFSLPIYDHGGRIVGVMGIDVSLQMLSEIVLNAKPSPNSYATLIDSCGTYIVHPNSHKRSHEFKEKNPQLNEVLNAMMEGDTDYRHVSINGTDSYIFYKPFNRTAVQGRSMEKLGWSVAVVYPADDIFGHYKQLLYVALGISLTGLLLLLIFILVITHRQLLPLHMLTMSAQRIANGEYNETVPDSRQQDEVGRLQNHFQQMQLALSTNIGKLEELRETLNEQGKVLNEAYKQAKEADRMKTSVLHNMTNQMTAPVSSIENDVSELVTHYQNDQPQKAVQLVDDIQKQGETVAELLNDLLEVSKNETPLKV